MDWEKEKARRERNGKIATVAIFAVVFLFLGLGINAGYQQFVWGYSFDQHIGGYFGLADQASSACTKSQYFDKFVSALQAYNLTHGQSAVVLTTPLSDMSTTFNTTLSLQDRLHQLCQTDPKSFEYQTGMQQITLQEFCWFPVDTFKQGYYLQHGVWGGALKPNNQANRCATHTA